MRLMGTQTDGRLCTHLLLAGLLLCSLAYAQDEATTEAPPSTTSNSNSSGSTNTTITTTTPRPQTTSTTTTVKPTKKPVLEGCPTICSCTQTDVDCSSRQLKRIPKFDPKSSFTRFNFANNSIETLDFTMLPMQAIEALILDNNNINKVNVSTKRNNELPRLAMLSLSDNELKSLDAMAGWRMPQLIQLHLDANSLTNLTSSDFRLKPKLERLNLSDLKLSLIEALTFVPLANLVELNLSRALETNMHLNEQLFVKNQLLELLDLSQNELLEVPIAVRTVKSLEHLILDDNSFTSLRRSDFTNLKNLKTLEIRRCEQLLRVEPYTFGELIDLRTLIISDNRGFFDFSSEAFKLPSSQTTTILAHQLDILDLSNNNISTLANPMKFSSIKSIQQLKLGSNPWHCNCALEWLVELPNLYNQQPIHCKTPQQFTGLEISQFFKVHDCEIEEESSLQKLVLLLFLFSLLLITVLVFVQKTDLCRRLQWRDQYGTIYYTKASFPTSDQA